MTIRTASPITIEVTRGALVESRHRVTVAVVDVAGTVVLQAGDVERPVYARSSIKPLQALAVVESGAADAFALTDAEVALACASHNGEARHTEAVHAWLERVGFSVADLECGAHAPSDAESAADLVRAGVQPTALHNNCSGKHAGFLTLVRHIGAKLPGYVRFDHPVQQRVLGILEQMTGLDLDQAPRGIDGCGIPVIAIPLGNIALAMARLAQPDDQPEPRQAAAARICHAMAAQPFMIAGTDRFDTRVIEATGGAALVKAGAEGFHCATLPALGLGVALKVEDGAKRAAEVAMAHMLRRLGVADTEGGTFDELIAPEVVNRRGETVGTLRAVAEATD